MLGRIYRDHPERWHDIVENFDTLGFSNFQPWLEQLGIGEDNAEINFISDYYNARCKYTDEWILHIFQRVAQENAKKYDKLLAVYMAEYNPLDNYDRREESTHTRTPDLTRATTSSAEDQTDGSSSTDTERKQTHTHTENAGTYRDSTDTSVAPYDSETPKLQTRIENAPTGSRSDTDSYSGEPDNTTTTTSATRTTSGSSTDTETGTDTTEIDSHIHGNIGVMSSQELAEREMKLADQMNIFKIIEKDLAAKLFIQVW